MSVKTIDQKIISMEVWHVSLPVTSRRDHGIGTVENNVEVVIVKLTCEGGECGYGEASPWVVFTGTPEGNFAAVDRYFRPFVVGSRVGDLADIIKNLEQQVVHCTEAKAALESALFDLAGRILGVPVWSLLGDKCRDEIPLSVSLANPSFSEDLDLVARLHDDGVGIVKVKTGFKDHAFDLMRIENLRKNYPDLDIRIDYNQGLRGRKDASERVVDIDSFNPSFIEQPVAAADFETMAILRKRTRNLLLADESVFAPIDMKRAIREQICDGVSIKIMKSGGMTRGIEISEIAADNNIPAYGGDMFETGVAHLAGVHMIAASPNISLGCEFYHSTYYLVEDLLDERFPIIDGKVQIPDTPGLGIAPDPDRLNKFALRYSDGKVIR